MAEQFLVTTTGTLSPVPLDDLGTEIIHPTTNLDLLLEFSADELAESADLQAAILGGFLTAVDLSGNSIAQTQSALNEALPVADTTPIAHDPADPTKQIRLDAGSVAVATTRTITMPDKDVLLDDAGDPRFPSNDSDLVHKTLAEVITGLKTFTAQLLLRTATFNPAPLRLDTDIAGSYWDIAPGQPTFFDNGLLFRREGSASNYEAGIFPGAGADGVLRLGNGVAGDCAYAFRDDTNTGMFRPGPDRLGFATAGVPRAEFEADGTLTVLTTDYETLVTADDDVPNKKYVDDLFNQLTTGFCYFSIWAEENAGLASGTDEWSYGNGATGNAIGIPVGIDCELYAVSFNAETFGTSVTIDVEQDGVVVATPLFGSNNLLVPVTPVSFSAGDRVNFVTNVVTGGFTDARVCAWFRVPIQAAVPLSNVDTSVVGVTGIGVNTAVFTTIPGLTTTVSLQGTGTVEGTFTYSAVRSGATNSITQFRVVVNGDNGTSYIDTLSTFNDTGAISHAVEGLAAGSYTVEVQASMDQPITVTAGTLKATATET